MVVIGTPLATPSPDAPDAERVGFRDESEDDGAGLEVEEEEEEGKVNVEVEGCRVQPRCVVSMGSEEWVAGCR